MRGFVRFDIDVLIQRDTVQGSGRNFARRRVTNTDFSSGPTRRLTLETWRRGPRWHGSHTSCNKDARPHWPGEAKVLSSGVGTPAAGNVHVCHCSVSPRSVRTTQGRAHSAILSHQRYPTARACFDLRGKTWFSDWNRRQALRHRHGHHSRMPETDGRWLCVGDRRV